MRPVAKSDQIQAMDIHPIHSPVGLVHLLCNPRFFADSVSDRTGLFLDTDASLVQIIMIYLLEIQVQDVQRCI